MAIRVALLGLMFATIAGIFFLFFYRLHVLSPADTSSEPVVPQAAVATVRTDDRTTTPPTSPRTIPSNQIVPREAIFGSKPERRIPGFPGRILSDDHVVVTEQAADQIKQMMRTSKAMYLRISVTESGFNLELDPTPDLLNVEVCFSRGIRIIVDKVSARSLPKGIIVDYAKQSNGFRIGSPGTDQITTTTSATLRDARKGFRTTLRSLPSQKKSAAPEPPVGIFDIIQYDAPPGRLTAYVSPHPQDGVRHPAIIWMTGGNSNTIDSGCWDADNPQSASAYRMAGIVMMFPSLRGGNDNPGAKEGYYGELDDIVAAATHLRRLPYIDSDRIYLGGHSTGGTLALLSAEYSSDFRAVFSFGPAEDILGYGPGMLPCVLNQPKELQLRSPILWLHSIRSPTFVFEGMSGNSDALEALAARSKNPKAHFYTIAKANHFNVLGPINRLIADKILRDTGRECNLAFTKDELNSLFAP